MFKIQPALFLKISAFLFSILIGPFAQSISVDTAVLTNGAQTKNISVAHLNLNLKNGRPIQPGSLLSMALAATSTPQQFLRDLESLNLADEWNALFLMDSMLFHHDLTADVAHQTPSRSYQFQVESVGTKSNSQSRPIDAFRVSTNGEIPLLAGPYTYNYQPARDVISMASQTNPNSLLLAELANGILVNFYLVKNGINDIILKVFVLTGLDKPGNKLSNCKLWDLSFSAKPNIEDNFFRPLSELHFNFVPISSSNISLQNYTGQQTMAFYQRVTVGMNWKTYGPQFGAGLNLPGFLSSPNTRDFFDVADVLGLQNPSLTYVASGVLGFPAIRTPGIHNEIVDIALQSKSITYFDRSQYGQISLQGSPSTSPHQINLGSNLHHILAMVATPHKVNSPHSVHGLLAARDPIGVISNLRTFDPSLLDALNETEPIGETSIRIDHYIGPNGVLEKLELQIQPDLRYVQDGLPNAAKFSSPRVDPSSGKLPVAISQIKKPGTSVSSRFVSYIYVSGLSGDSVLINYYFQKESGGSVLFHALLANQAAGQELVFVEQVYQVEVSARSGFLDFYSIGNQKFSESDLVNFTPGGEYLKSKLLLGSQIYFNKSSGLEFVYPGFSLVGQNTSANRSLRSSLDGDDLYSTRSPKVIPPSPPKSSIYDFKSLLAKHSAAKPQPTPPPAMTKNPTPVPAPAATSTSAPTKWEENKNGTQRGVALEDLFGRALQLQDLRNYRITEKSEFTLNHQGQKFILSIEPRKKMILGQNKISTMNAGTSRFPVELRIAGPGVDFHIEEVTVDQTITGNSVMIGSRLLETNGLYELELLYIESDPFRLGLALGTLRLPLTTNASALDTNTSWAGRLKEKILIDHRTATTGGNAHEVRKLLGLNTKVLCSQIPTSTP